ncbi:MAG: type I methionyl aminopeptidase [Rubrobacteraceae bacterium]
MIVRKSRAELETMREGGKITAACHRLIAGNIRPGVTTKELDSIAEDFIRSKGGTPEFLGYPGQPGAVDFPGSICASPNHMIVHGIPGKRRLEEGDIISIDIGTRFEGFVTDSAWTYPVGEISDVAKALLEVTERCLHAATDQMRPGKRFGDVGHAIQSVAEPEGYGVVRDLVSHEVGREMHGTQMPNYGKPGTGTRLLSGMTFAIEPMITVGTYEIVLDNRDGWSIYTADGSLAAHFEHTIAVTEDGPWVLTLEAGEEVGRAESA